jgi:outer membrane protein assembly factor BamB
MKLKNKAIFGIMLTLLLITTITSAHSFYLIKASSGTSGSSSFNRLIVVAGSDNGNVYTYNEKGKLLWSYNTGADVASVAMSSDGAYIAVGSLGNKLYLFSRDGIELWEKNVPISSGYAGGWMGTESKTVAISAHGEYVIAGCTDNLYVYKKDGTLQWSHTGKETCVGIAPNGTYIVSCNNADGTMHLFSSSSGTPLWTQSISAFWVATSNLGYVAASSHTTVYLYNNAGTPVWSYHHSKWDSDFIRVDMSQDGLGVVAVNDDPSNYPGCVLCYWNHLKDGTLGWSSADSTPVWIYEPGGGPGDTDFYSVAISGSGDYIATGPSYGSCIFSRTSNVPLQTFNFVTANSFALTLDGQYGACGNRQGELYYFSKDSSTPLWSKTIGGMVHAVAISYLSYLADREWTMYGHDPACTSYSPSNAPNANTTAWVSNLPGGTAWAYPLVAEEKVFIGAGGYLNAFNETDGSLLWNFRAPAQPGYPGISAVADGMVFFGTAEPGPEGCIYALNTTTGEQIWNFTTEGYVRAPPVIVEDRLYIGGDLDGTGKLYCINATTGASLWNYTTQDRMTSVAVAYDRVYASCGHWETDTQAAVYCLDMYDGSYVWSFDTGRDISGGLSVANGKVYFSASYEGWDCIVYALNATNGDVVWSTTRYSDGSAGNTAVAYGKVFIQLGYYTDGIYALNETNGDEIWASHGPSGGGPVVADGKVFFARGNPANVFCAVNEATGAVIWNYTFVGGVHSRTSAIANGRVFVADHWDQKLYAFWSYDVTIEAFCNTESSYKSVSITMDGLPTGYNTPHTFTGLIGTHNFTVPSNDSSAHPFIQWSTGSISTTITVNSGGTYTAYYQAKCTLTIATTVGGTTNPLPGSYIYWSGTIVSVSATPSTEYRFDHWTLDGSNVGSYNPISVTMNNDHTLIAFFAPKPYFIPKGGGGDVKPYPLFTED